MSIRQPKAKKALKSEMFGIMFVGLALLLLFVIMGKPLGVVGGLEKILRYALGRGAFLCPLSLALLGIKCFVSPEEQLLSGRFLTQNGFLLFLLLLFHQYTAPENNALSPEYLPVSGGVVSGFVVHFLRIIIGDTGCWLFLCSGTLILFIAAFRLSLRQTAENAGKGIHRAVDAVASRRGEKSSFFNYEKVWGKDQPGKTEKQTAPPVMRMPENNAKSEPIAVFSLNVNRKEQAPKPPVYAEQPKNIPPADEDVAEETALLPFATGETAEIPETPEPCPVDEFARTVEEEPEEYAPDIAAEARNPYLLYEADGDLDLYRLPHTGILDKPVEGGRPRAAEESAAQAAVLEQTLSDFKVAAKIINVVSGPSVTRFEIEPAPGVKVSKITSLADDLTLRLAVSGIRMETAIPGKSAMGIEVPRKASAPVLFYDVASAPEFEKAESKLTMALGKDITGKTIIADMGKMPHLLVAGSTGSGKSVCINTIINSILFKACPSEVKFIMIDPKVVELSTYNGIPHLLAPVVTDPKKAANVLAWAVAEMERRYQSFAQAGVRNIIGYNESSDESSAEKLPYIVIIIDELADLMMVAPGEVENAICRLAQKARAAGLHLILATQRPSVDVITGIIKANIPSRIAFAVSSQIDSRTILDAGGAEKLLGKGDMLYYPVGLSKPLRLQGAFISDKEIENIANYISNQSVPVEYSYDIPEYVPPNDKHAAGQDGRQPDNPQNGLMPKALEIFMQRGRASASLLQSELGIGYPRAAKIINIMENKGIIGMAEPNSSKPRKLLVSYEVACSKMGVPQSAKTAAEDNVNVDFNTQTGMTVSCYEQNLSKTDNSYNGD